MDNLRNEVEAESKMLVFRQVIWALAGVDPGATSSKSRLSTHLQFRMRIRLVLLPLYPHRLPRLQLHPPTFTSPPAPELFLQTVLTSTESKRIRMSKTKSTTIQSQLNLTHRSTQLWWCRAIAIHKRRSSLVALSMCNPHIHSL